MSLYPKKSFALALAFVVLGINTAQAADKYTTFHYAVYKNTECSGKLVGKDLIDTSAKCYNYSYVDSKGVTFAGSMGNFRCYKDKIVLDKYPFAKDCDASKSIYQGKKVVELNASVPIDPACQIAPSHEGKVSEHIEDYTYSGNENCSITDK